MSVCKSIVRYCTAASIRTRMVGKVLTWSNTLDSDFGRSSFTTARMMDITNAFGLVDAVYS